MYDEHRTSCKVILRWTSRASAAMSVLPCTMERRMTDVHRTSTCTMYYVHIVLVRCTHMYTIYSTMYIYLYVHSRTYLYRTIERKEAGAGKRAVSSPAQHNLVDPVRCTMYYVLYVRVLCICTMYKVRTMCCYVQVRCTVQCT